MTTIRVSCTDQVMRLVERPTLASGGVNEAVVKFDFCEKWDGFAKTAVFYRDEEQLYPMLLENDSCFIPWEVYSTPGTFYFTVFGVKEEIRKTANTLRYKATKGIPDGEMIPSEPTQEMYEQIIDRLDKLEQNGGSGGGVSEEQLEEAVNEALAQAKASGEFDGEDGEDYVLTEADKTEIAEEAAQLVPAPDVQIPSALPNPNALTFTGAVSATYDGSKAVQVEIPQGGGGGGKTYHVTDLITTEEVEKIVLPLQNMEDCEIFIITKTGNINKINITYVFPPINGSKYQTYKNSTPQASQDVSYWYVRLFAKNVGSPYHRSVRCGKKETNIGTNGPYWIGDSQTENTIEFVQSTSGEVFPIGTEIHMVEAY